MKLKIGDRLYDVTSIKDLSLKMLLQLEQQLADFGRPLRVSDIEQMVAEIEKLPEKEQPKHPDVMWITAISIWAARKLAGEDVTFDEAIDFPITSLTIVKEPKDRKAPANPTRARPASGRASAPRKAAAAAAR